MDVFDDFKGNRSKLQQRSVDVGIGEQAYFHLRRLALKAEKDGDKVARDAILLRLAKCDRQSNDACRALYEKYDRTVEPSTAPLARPQVAAEPEVAGATKVSTDTEWGRLDWMAAYGQLQRIRGYYAEQRLYAAFEDFNRAILRIGNLVRYRYDAVNATLASVSVQEHPLLRVAERQYLAIGNKARLAAESNDDEKAKEVEEARMGLHRATMKVLRELTAKYGPLKGLVEQIERWEQSGPVPAAPPANGRRPPSETVQPPALAAGSGSGAPGTPLRARPWDEDDFAVERALMAGKLPPGFDASLLMAEASIAEEHWLVVDLEAGRLPTRTIDGMLALFEATGEGGSHAPFIEYLRSVREDIVRALRAAYPGRTEPEWLDRVRARLLPRAEQVLRSGSESGYTVRGSGTPGGSAVV